MQRLMLIMIPVAAILALTLVAVAGSRDAPEGTRSVPKLIPYQGVLERNGQLVNALGSDTVSFRVSLYDAPAAGQKVWPAEPSVYDEHTVNVHNGRFAFSIGSNPLVPYLHVANTPLWLEIQVKGPDDPDFVPLGGRQQFQSAPYAVAADRADTDFQVPGNLTVEVDTAVAGDLDVGTTGIPSELDVKGTATVSETATVGRLTFSIDSSSMNRLVHEEYASVPNVYEAGCPYTEYPNCVKLIPTSQGACFLSSNHGDLTCEIAKGSDGTEVYWWMLSNAFAGHLRQCRVVCLKWNSSGRDP